MRDFHLSRGEALLLQGVKITQAQPFGPVHLALAIDPISGEFWTIVSDQPTTLQTFAEYGVRFQIEESFLDDKSNRFELESSWIRSAPALSRLCLVIAVATLDLTVQGQQVVEKGNRRWVDAHSMRGNSYLRIGWEWVKGSLHQRWRREVSLHLSGQPDSQPAMASRKQAQKQYLREFTVKSKSYAA